MLEEKLVKLKSLSSKEVAKLLLIINLLPIILEMFIIGVKLLNL